MKSLASSTIDVNSSGTLSGFNFHHYYAHIQSLILKPLHIFYIYGNIENMDIKSAVTQLSSIAQEARLEIFRLLVQAGIEGLPAGSIGEQLKIPPSTLSFHLKELSHAGLINSRQVSRFIYYTANYAAMNGLLAYLTENCCAGVSECCPEVTSCHPEKGNES